MGLITTVMVMILLEEETTVADMDMFVRMKSVQSVTAAAGVEDPAGVRG